MGELPVSGMPRFINYLRMLYAFPNEMKAREDDYPLMFTKLYPGIKQERGIKEYLRGGRRLIFYQHGVFRHYTELDRQLEWHYNGRRDSMLHQLRLAF